MIIKLIHFGQTDLKHVGCLIRLPEEKSFLRFLKLKLLGDILELPTNRKLSFDLLCKFYGTLTLKKDYCTIRYIKHGSIRASIKWFNFFR